MGAGGAVSLREIQGSDLGLINSLRSEEVALTLGAPFRFVSPEADQAWLEAYRANRGANARMAILEGGDPVGVAYLLGIDWVSRSAEFAMAIAPSGQGRGVGLAAGRLATRHAFSDLNLSRLHLTVLSSHAKAKSLYAKLGFVKEGEHPASVWKRGAWAGQESWALLREDRK